MFHKKLKKTFAIFLLLTFGQSVFLPTVAHALTSGPSAPEASAFESFDTSDLVNLSTGDFTYNMPLLSVPGSGINFPINLFYHAGIKTNQEASSVGLGWGINPGAINRSVNSFPDDYYLETTPITPFDYQVDEETYDEGTVNQTDIFSLGIPGTPLSLSYTDNYNSRVGSYGVVAMNIQITRGVNIGISSRDGFSVSFGVAPGVSIGLSSRDGFSVSANTFQLFQAGLRGLGFGGRFLASASLWKSSSTNVNDWLVETKEGGIHLGNIGWRRIEERRSLRKTKDVHPVGSLHLSSFDLTTGQGIKSMDIITDKTSNKLEDNQGATHIAYDDYVVFGQGVGGSIQPKVFQNASLIGKLDGNHFYKDFKDFDGYQTIAYPSNTLVQYRYDDEFASNYEMLSGQINVTSSSSSTHNSGTGEVTTDPQITVSSSSSQFIQAPVDNQNQDGTINAGFKNRYLKGKRHIEWFTEKDLYWDDPTLKIKNFVLNKPSTFRQYPWVSGQRDDVKIQAFKITGEDGTVYEYGLPVYVLEEMMVNFPAERLENGDYVHQTTPTKAYYKQRKNAAYTYSWLQTSILGSDYVDRNNNNQTDEDDWGSYVEFTYGNHTKDKGYPFRGPFQGYDPDVTFENRMANSGKKQLFYINSIQTRTHSAVFFYDTRFDGLGATKDAMNDPIPSSSVTSNQLALKEIRLFKNEDLKELIQTHGFSDYGIINASTINDNVYKLDDLGSTGSSLNSKIIEKSIRTVKFNQTYDLCEQTLNSTTYSRGEKMGKLTLKEVAILGKNEEGIMPSYQFDYDESSSTSNPDYNINSWDRWGYYNKHITLNGQGYPTSRLVSNNQDADAWSLRKIITPLGAELEINYETDDYATIGNHNGLTPIV